MLILLGCILAAVGTGIWAINTVRQNLNQSTTPNSSVEELDGLADAEGDSIWNEAADMVTDEMNGEIVMEDADSSSGSVTAAQQESEAAAIVTEPNPSEAPDGQTAPDLPSELSTDSSGALFSSEPSVESVVLEPQADAATPSFVLPVTGAVIKEFSGDELVYNETLGDWRTHNGVDYAAELGDEVISPIAGEVITITTDGNWGGVVELLDEKGNTWRFCGVEQSTLQVGDAVGISQVIGQIGIISAESAEEPHLHLEILTDGAYQDPSDYLQ